MTTTKRKSQDSSTRHAMSARLLELFAETNLPEAYPITDDIVIDPPTRTRRQAMHEAEMRLFMCRQMLATALAAAAEPAPSPPPEATAPEPEGLDDDATDEQREDHVKATAAWLIRRSYETAVEEWLTRKATVEANVETINAKVRAASDDYDKAFFGDAYAAVTEYFEDKPTLWDKFIPDIKAEFLPKAPDDGKCSACGQIVDPEAAKKVPASST